MASVGRDEGPYEEISLTDGSPFSGSGATSTLPTESFESESSLPPRTDKGKQRARPIEDEEEPQEEEWTSTLQRETLEKLSRPRQQLGGKGCFMHKSVLTI